MSWIAGIVSLDERRLMPSLVEKTMQLVPHESGTVNRWGDDYATIVQLDFGAFGEPAFWRDDGGVTALAGHPLLPGDRTESSADGHRGARVLHNADEERFGQLARVSTGTWAGVSYRAAQRVLLLCSDRVGIRPLYWWTDGAVCVFSSTIAFMERHPLVPLTLDLQAVVEGATLGYAVSDRTPYYDVRRMLSGEIVRLMKSGVTRSHHFRWAGLPQRPVDDPAREIEVLAALRSAVDRRNGSRSEAVTLLSGGLDSRVINTILYELGVHIHSFNFSIPETQDAYFAGEFARHIKADHYEGEPVGGSAPGWVGKSGQVWNDRLARSGAPLRSLFPIWSGDFGSVTAGWVGMTPSLLTTLRTGRIEEAFALFLRARPSLAPADLVPEARDWFRAAVPRALAEEFAKHSADDPARQFMFFYVSNTQRRHMDAFYEEILDHRTEFWTPFIDAAFLEAALSVPADDGVGHGFYMRWFERLPAVARAVPWQTYPGHMPCPLPVPPGLRTQWDSRTKSARNRRAGARIPRWNTLWGRFPSPLFRRHRFLMRSLLHQLRLKDSRVALNALEHFARHWDRAESRPLPWRPVEARSREQVTHP
jgi:asparagine synthase (glutamine-hydrolysing)